MDNKKSDENLKTLSLIFIVIFLLWISSIYLLSHFFPELNERGIFGDSFGAINALFSGLAFGGIIYTILLQKRELKLQRSELTLTRKELKRTADAQEKINNFQNEQLRLSNLPVFQFQSVGNNHRKIINVRNISGKTAFDVDLWVLAHTHNDRVSKSDFLEANLKESYNETLNEFGNLDYLLDGEIWCIADRGCLPSFETGSQMNVDIDYPLDYCFYVIFFMQYRDSLENNYALRYDFESTNNDRRPFRFISQSPKVLKVQERIDFHELESYDSNLHLPYIEGIIDTKQASVLAGLLKNYEFKGVESKWEVNPISS